MDRSESIQELATALAKAQGEIEGALRDSENPFFKTKYADLSSVVAAIKPAHKHGLSFVQPVHSVDGHASIETIILHSSGEWLSCGRVTVPVLKQDAQSYGSALTYCRRYSLSAAFGVAPEDDDGNEASKRPTTENRPKPAPESGQEKKAAQRASSASPVDPDAPIGPDRATKLLSYLGGLGFAGPHVLNTARKYKHIGPDGILADLTEGAATALIARMRAKLPGQTKGEPPVTPKGDSESQAFEAAQALETDIDLGDVDLCENIRIMVKHSTFDGDMSVIEAINAAGDDRDKLIDVARTMRDALIGTQPEPATVTA